MNIKVINVYNLILLNLLTSSHSLAQNIKPIIETKWGQGGLHQVYTPRITHSWDPDVWLGQSYLGCVTIATSQIINHYQFQDLARLTSSPQSCYFPTRFDQAGLVSSDIDASTGELCTDIPENGYDFTKTTNFLPSVNIDKNNNGLIDNDIYQGFTQSEISSFQYTAEFLYNISVLLNAQFGGKNGADVVPKKLTDLFKYSFGYGSGFSRSEKIETVFKSEGFTDQEWSDLIWLELQAGRPVIYSGYTEDESAGHTFILDGYKVIESEEYFHVNWGWSGTGNGYYKLANLSDYQGRSWATNPNIVRAIEPSKDYILNHPKYDYSQLEDQVFNYSNSLSSGQFKSYGPFDNIDGAIEISLESNKNADLYIKKGSSVTTTNYDCVSKLKSFKSSSGAISHKEHCVLHGSGAYYVGVKSLYSSNNIELEVTTQVNQGSAITDYQWHGTGSVISKSSGTKTGYGMTQDELRIASPNQANNIVFFQWEIDSSDGNKLEIKADHLTDATITYGDWSTRDADRTYKNVKLPFILDPAKDNKSNADGEYYTIAVAFDQAPTQDVTVEVQTTNQSASTATSMTAVPFTINNHTWNGNSSLISKSTGSDTGYGLTQDLAQIHSNSPNKPVVFAQWEVDLSDGEKLLIDSSDSNSNVTITYGVWNDRNNDVTITTTLPYSLDFHPNDGEYYVIKVEFDAIPTEENVDVSFDIQ